MILGKLLPHHKAQAVPSGFLGANSVSEYPLRKNQQVVLSNLLRLLPLEPLTALWYCIDDLLLISDAAYDIFINAVMRGSQHGTRCFLVHSGGTARACLVFYLSYVCAGSKVFYFYVVYPVRRINNNGVNWTNRRCFSRSTSTSTIHQ